MRVAIKHGGRGPVFGVGARRGWRRVRRLEAMPPAGRFTVAAGGGPRTYLGVAAGSGITPVLSIMKHVLAREPGSRIVLLYGSRRTADILFREELEALKDRFMGRLSVVHVLSREAAGYCGTQRAAGWGSGCSGCWGGWCRTWLYCVGPVR